MKNCQGAILYCTYYSEPKFIVHNTPILSRFQQFTSLGFRFLVIGFSDKEETEVVNVGGMNVCFIYRKLKPKHMITEIAEYFPEYNNVRLVIARDLPSTGYALRITKKLTCSAYYESIETWTGYYVHNNGKKVIPTYYRKYLSERCRIRRFKRVIAHSHTSLQHLIKLYRLIRDRTVVLYSVLPRPNTEKRKSPLYKKLPQIKSSDRVIICSGSIFPKRGLEELIECFRFIRKQYKLVIFGNGPLEEELKKRVIETNLVDQVFFLPFVPMENYIEILAGADIGIDFRTATNLNYDLACSIRLIDYMNCRLPIITSATQGFKYIANQCRAVRCVPRQLSVSDKAAYIEKLGDTFSDNKEGFLRELDIALDREFSFEANLRKLKSCLREDGIRF